MTIAACYFTSEGVVLGADSTTTFTVETPQGGIHHFFNHGQKLFEVGDGSSLGMVTWGLANLGDISHRTRIAKLSDEIKAKPEKFKTLKGIADYWNEHVFSAYENFYDTDKKRDERKRAHELFAIQEKDRTEDQKKERRTTSGERNRFLPGWLPSFGPSPGCVRDLLRHFIDRTKGPRGTYIRQAQLLGDAKYPPKTVFRNRFGNLRENLAIRSLERDRSRAC